MVQKPLKIRPPCHILPDYFLTRLSFKNLNQVAIDAKSVLTFENRPLVAELFELKLKT